MKSEMKNTPPFGWGFLERLLISASGALWQGWCNYLDVQGCGTRCVIVVYSIIFNNE